MSHPPVIPHSQEIYYKEIKTHTYSQNSSLGVLTLPNNDVFVVSFINIAVVGTWYVDGLALVDALVNALALVDAFASEVSL